MENIKESLAKAERIRDPKEREKEMARIQRVILGTEPVPTTEFLKEADKGVPDKPQPAKRSQVTMEDAQEQNQLMADFDLSEKMKPEVGLFGGERPQRMSAYSDEELKSLIEGFGGPDVAKQASEEDAIRKNIDEKGLARLFDPNYINRLAGNVVGGAVNSVVSGPPALAGLLAKGAEKLTGSDLGADQLLKISSDEYRDINSGVGISAPRDIGESAAGLLPSILPIPGLKAPTGVLTNVAEVLTPMTIGSGPRRIIANFTTAAVADQALREAADSQGDPYHTVTDVAGLTGGPEDKGIDPSILQNAMIGFGALSGASFIPAITAKAMKAFKGNKPPSIVDIVDIDSQGPKGLQSLERAGDWYKTGVVDEKSVLSGLYSRAGVPDYDVVNRLIDTDTHVSALMRVNEASRTGVLNTYGGRWKVDVTPGQLSADFKRLPTAMQEDVDSYLKYHDFMDDMKLRIQHNIDPQQAINLLTQARQAIALIDGRTPIAKDFLAKYSHITGQTRKYLSQGPNAMIGGKSLGYLGRFRKNWVPTNLINIDPKQNLIRRIVDSQDNVSQKRVDAWYQQKRDLKSVTSIEGRGSAMDALVDWTHNALRSKMEHDVRGAYIRGMRASDFGAKTMRRASSKEIEKHPERIVYLYENGKRKAYLSSKLQRDLLQFDPYVAKFPLTYAARRMFEKGTTSALSITFPVTTMLRDSLGGFITMPKGYKGPGLGAPVALSKILYAKGQMASMELLGKNFERLPFLDPAAKKRLAQQTSNSLMNSYYHMAAQHGSADASILQTSIESGRTAFAQLQKTIGDGIGSLPGGGFVKTMGYAPYQLLRGAGALLNAMSESPRFASFERNVKAGKSPTDAVVQARKLTGDNTRSGRFYKPNGQRIGVDAANKEFMLFADKAAYAGEAIREGVPYVNPTIQGLRRVAEAFRDDPIGTNLKAWGAVGLPALLMMGWNEMQGEEYNKFAFQERTSKDIAGNFYMAIPGRPPEQGIQIPMPLEFQLWKSPFETAMYGLMRGSEGDETQAVMMHMAATSIANAGMVGFPQILSVPLAFAGKSSPESLNPFSWKDDIYNVREDNVGIFPQNYEGMLRETFGGITDTLMMSASAFHDGGPEAFFEEMGAQILKRTAVVKQLTGTTTPVSNFTPLDVAKRNKVKSASEFIKMYEDFVEHPNTINKRPPGDTKGLYPDDSSDSNTSAYLAPLQQPKPNNPLLFMYGGLVKEALGTNAEGFTGVNSHYSVVSEQIRLLKSYTAGNKGKFREWQKNISGADKRYQDALKPLQEQMAAIPVGPGGKAKKGFGEQKKAIKDQMDQVSSDLGELAKADRLIKQLNLDLSKRSDVTKLVSYLERERGEMMEKQYSLINDVEDRINADLQSKGFLLPGQRFSIEKHLGAAAPTGLLRPPPTPLQVQGP